jgi:GNAT superfamily N-acetyltransferase
VTGSGRPGHQSAARLEGTWARHAVALAHVMRAQAPWLGTRSFPLADGHVVLQGPGMFVNRALAVGLLAELNAADLHELERESAASGVPAAVDVVPDTLANAVQLLRESGYQPTTTVGVMTMELVSTDIDVADPAIGMRWVDAADLALWQRVSIDAWDHQTPERRRASDVYAAAAFGTPGERLVIAIDRTDGRPLGCASLAVRDGIATLGGMSTLPSERRRGVQRALVAERLHHARVAGADLAATSALEGGPSQRNLIRLGFEPRYAKITWVKPIEGA